MLEKFNSFMEKWMAFVTPACLLTGVLFPDIAKHGVPYVTYAFAFMTFIGALKSRFRDVADVFKRPLPLILMLLILHVLGPVAACGAAYHYAFASCCDTGSGLWRRAYFLWR